MSGECWSLFLVLVLFGSGCAPSANTLGWERSDGTLVVERAVEAHGGVERWRSFETVSFDYTEHWSAPFTWFGNNPWPRNDVAVHLRLWLHEARAECTFLGEAAPSWVWRGGAVEQAAGGAYPGDDWRPDFVIPRTHYLTLLPFKFLDGGARAEYIRGSDADDRVLVSFPTGAGETPRDRYWVRFDRASGRLTGLVLTVTAYGPFAVGDLTYEDYQEVQGLLMPARIRARLNGPGLPLHVGEYRSIRFE